MEGIQLQILGLNTVIHLQELIVELFELNINPTDVKYKLHFCGWETSFFKKFVHIQSWLGYCGSWNESQTFIHHEVFIAILVGIHLQISGLKTVINFQLIVELSAKYKLFLLRRNIFLFQKNLPRPIDRNLGSDIAVLEYEFQTLIYFEVFYSISHGTANKNVRTSMERIVGAYLKRQNILLFYFYFWCNF